MLKRLSSVFRLKCPRCQEGDLFETSTFSFHKPFHTPDKCSRCHQSFWPEPGFYYGAMFISYIFMGWFSLGFVMVLHWVLKMSLEASFLLLILVCALGYVYIFRLSRSIWIHITVKHDPNALDSLAKQQRNVSN